MPDNKDKKPQSDSKGSMDNKSDREFKGQGTGTPGNFEDDDMTAGGREGQFSDKNRDREGQWSPGSSQSSDQ
jgi:hypothetical protein